MTRAEIRIAAAKKREKDAMEAVQRARKKKGECVATLNGSRDHLHLHCRACNMVMME